MNNKKSRKLTIGIITDHIEGNYQSGFWPGFLSTAREKDISLMFFAGISPKAPFSLERYHNIVFDLVSNQSLDGVVLLSGVLKTYLNNDEFDAFLEKFEGLPMVSISYAGSQIPSINTNYDGLYDAYDHLIRYHNYKKIAFICGAPQHPDAIERLRIYKEVLKNNNIPYDDRLVVPGFFTIDAGKKGVETLIVERQQDVDVIVGASDDIAIGAIYRLSELDISVPGDIAVIGFDDTNDAHLFSPPLTTVQQPVFKQSKMAIEMLLDIIEHGKRPGNVVLSSRLVIRQSCGCSLQSLKCFPDRACIDAAAPSDHTGPNTRIDRAVTDSILKEIELFAKSVLLVDHHPVYEWITRLVECLLGDSRFGDTRSLFISIIYGCPFKEVLETADEVFLYDLISHIESVLYKNILFEKDVRQQLGKLFIEARLLMGELMLRPDIVTYANSVEETINIRLLSQQILSSYSLENLKTVLKEHLPLAGIRSCYIVLYEGEARKIDDISWDIPNFSKLVMSFNIDVNMEVKNDIIFNTLQLLPCEVYNCDKSIALVIKPLFFQDEQFGYILQNFSTDNYNVYETFRNLISSSIKGAALFEEEKKIAESLNNAKKKLEDSNFKLTKLDDLKNDFIANITHDFRSPLMVIMNTADLGYKYDTDFSEKQVKQRYKAILTASVKLSESIDRLLDLSRMDAGGLKIIVNGIKLKSYLSYMAQVYCSMIVNSRISFKTDFPEEEVEGFYSDSEKLEEILMNLFSNALKYVDPDTGIITIRLLDKKDSVEIHIEDNGIGIPSEKLESIFNRFEQVHEGRDSPYQGSGIGLAYAKQLTEYLKGNIRAESGGTGKGARFIITFNKGTEIFKDDPNIEIRSEEVREIIMSEKKVLNIKSEIDTNIEYQSDLNQNEVVLLDKLNTLNEFNFKKAIFLIVEDSRQTREIFIEYLRKAGYSNFIITRDGKQGLAAAFKYRPDIVICDYNMPKMKGDVFHDQLTGNPDFANIPFLFISAVLDRKIILERKKKGAVAYLQKPIEEDEFITSVDTALQRYMQFKKIFLQANSDPLTAVYNKRFLLHDLEFKLQKRSLNHLSLILVDIDNFKDLNDKNGYHVGDIVLATLGREIKKFLNNYDVVGRFGGKEFLIVLDGTSSKQAAVFAEKILESIRSMKIEYKDIVIQVTASIGIASLLDNEQYICEQMQITNLGELYKVRTNGEVSKEHISNIGNRLVQLLINIANIALFKAKATTCNNCKYTNFIAKKFKDGHCPQCNSSDLDPGRNKVAVFEG